MNFSPRRNTVTSSAAEICRRFSSSGPHKCARRGIVERFGNEMQWLRREIWLSSLTRPRTSPRSEMQSLCDNADVEYLADQARGIRTGEVDHAVVFAAALRFPADRSWRPFHQDALHGADHGVAIALGVVVDARLQALQAFQLDFVGRVVGQFAAGVPGRGLKTKLRSWCRSRYRRSVSWSPRSRHRFRLGSRR